MSHQDVTGSTTASEFQRECCLGVGVLVVQHSISSVLRGSQGQLATSEWTGKEHVAARTPVRTRCRGAAEFNTQRVCAVQAAR